MADEPSKADAALEEQLVAYLDGELDAEAGRRIEQLLAVDSGVRRKLQYLQGAWELLDELETSPVEEDFTRSTLEMVTVAAGEEVKQGRAQASRTRRQRRAVAAAGLFAAAAAGFAAVALWLPDPNWQLLDDLPVLESFDEYRQIDDIEFLRTLHREAVFAEEAGDGQ